MDVPTNWINQWIQWPTGWVRCPVYFGIPGLLRKESAPLKCLISCWVGMVQNWIIYKNKNASFAYSKFVFLISQRNIKKMPQLCEASTNYMFSPPRGRQPISSTKSDGIWLPSPKLTQVGVERFVSAQIRRFSGSNCKFGGVIMIFPKRTDRLLRMSRIFLIIFTYRTMPWRTPASRKAPTEV